MKKRYILGGLLAAVLLWPVGYIELACRPANQGTVPYKSLLTAAKDQRPEARTLLTYPEWHIVYSAESLARHLKTRPPSGYRYLRDISSFWSSYCALNSIADPKAGGDAKIMLYTIGISFSAEMLVKAGYENTIGRLFEWMGGWHSPDDLYAARVQQHYGAFMHETPWYEFPFGRVFDGLWSLNGGGIRHWERRAALSLEYGVKTGYANLIGWASGTALGADERTMRIVLAATPEQIAAVDSRLKIVSSDINGTIVDTPRYAQFTALAIKLADAGIRFREIAGNDDIFVTVIAPTSTKSLATPLLAMPLADRAGWERRGYMLNISMLSDMLVQLSANGATLEHIYDY